MRDLRKLVLGLTAIALAALILLWGDWDNRYRVRGARANASTTASTPTTAPVQAKRIGLAYFGPEQTVDECMQGLLSTLDKSGLREGTNLFVRRVHAQGEIVNIAPMLQALDAEGLDAIVTMSTPVLSAACGIVKRTPIVLTYCFDPLAAGAGKSLDDHLPTVTGVGSFPPLERMIELVRDLQPRPTRVGVIYNASEANSSRRVAQARTLFAGIGVELESTTIASSSEVLMAAQALTARGVDAFWAVGDNTAVQAIDAIMKTARDARVPVVADDPTHVDRGAIAGVGVAFHEVGVRTAPILLRVLNGESPANIPIQQLTVLDVAVDPMQARQLGVTLPESILREANRGPFVRTARPARLQRIDLLSFVESDPLRMAIQGLHEGFAEDGWIVGTDYELRPKSAQGDISMLPNLVDACSQGDADLVLTLTTPPTQAALRRLRNKRMVYGLVANGVLAGAGSSATDHLPFATGVDVPAPIRMGVEALVQCLPRARRLGTLFVPGEVNSVYYKTQLEEACKERGLELVAVGINSAAEIADAALALSGRNIDAVAQIIDNASAAGFATVAAAAERAGLPTMGWSSDQINKGAFLTVATDFTRNGADTARVAARVLQGADPATISLGRTTDVRVQINLQTARKLGVSVPAEVLKQAQVVIGADAPKEQPR
jgi:ABC-type uncharacterized transport system substrate-binding protein